MLERLRKFLRESKYDDFKDERDFAEQAFSNLDDELRAAWSSARGAINRATKSIYRFYRLKDPTPFGDTSSIKLRFGGPDTRSVKFFGDLDYFYFSKFAPNKSEELKRFLRERYLENGSKIFGNRTPEELQDFRNAAGDKLKNLNDRAISAIVTTSVQRIRNQAHFNSLRQAKVTLAKIVAITDERTSEICTYLNGKLIRVKSAAETIDRLSTLSPEDYAQELYKSDAAKTYNSDPINYVKKRITDDVLNDDLVAEGKMPPFHVNCRSRVKGVISGALG